ARLFLNGGALGATRILSSASIDQMAVDQTQGRFNPVPSDFTAFGLGWDSVSEPALKAVGVRGWAKNGGSLQYGAQILLAPADGLAVVVMGTNGNGYDPATVAQRVMLRALTESGRISAFPAPLANVAAPVATPPAGLMASISGDYANYEGVSQLRAEPDGSLTLLSFNFSAGGFVPFLSGLRYRGDGWFSADAQALAALKVVEADGRQYLAMRMAAGMKHYQTLFASAQRVNPAGLALSPAWRKRLDLSWLIVNESPDSMVIAPASNPRFTLGSVPGLDGLLLAKPAGGMLLPNLLDPSLSDSTARMMLVIPGNNGRDLNDLDILLKDGQEWLRWGGWIYRPLASVPLLPGGGASSVAMGSEGLAEWRALQAGPVPVQIAVSGATAWRLYDPDFMLLASGTASGRATLAAGARLAYLMLFGVAHSAISVSLS
ncbi:MAG: hypothetical protein ACOYNZ_09625, partial [Rhodoferax sp.]